MNYEKLESMLKEVPGSYPEFVHWVLGDAHEFGTCDELISYIDAHPDDRDDDIIEASARIAGVDLS